MKIKYGMILAAGLGTRMQPITLKTPKPLLKIGNNSLLERSINLLANHGVEEIVINVHHLASQIKEFLQGFNINIKISISNEENLLLDTGGGVKQGTKHFNKNPFFIINPDTLWSDNYLEEIKILEKLYFRYCKPCLLLVEKKLSLDNTFKGDFNLKESKVSRDKNNNFIFTGLQIMNRQYFEKVNDKVFSMNKIWNKLILEKDLIGLESKQKFYHLNTIEMYKKINDLKIID
tara:strand:+ start:169 stop:867 length:699 start_codon:yes stop_codon:yes gene_type:complete